VEINLILFYFHYHVIKLDDILLNIALILACTRNEGRFSERIGIIGVLNIGDDHNQREKGPRV
jgi:hypothetical protein